MPKQHLPLFPASPDGGKLSHLERYATRLRCMEINSSFHRPHRRSTWERWAASVPDDFRFAVKAPKSVTHTAKLINTGAMLLDFFAGVSGLGNKLGPILVQLPPKLSFDEGIAHEFLTTLRELHTGNIVLEARNATWFTAAADCLLRDFQVARVAADPPKGSDLAARPGGWQDLHYWRLHGTPRTYYSEYEEPRLREIAEEVLSPKDSQQPSETWIIFDNTALGHATANAVQMQLILEQGAGAKAPR
ncbi:DUF72 domain-containing protein [Terriglobus aquaticus]|uniref:DUF72 domain-containing protein n=1 Tax=Terriglobus aquaticus TaxID=940139 RepID=A0ABW9KLS1_9BACT|nr:DUF72 domain-containing protein [Terriglobus aquaticus]